jgi:hypothetical protein
VRGGREEGERRGGGSRERVVWCGGRGGCSLASCERVLQRAGRLRNYVVFGPILLNLGAP